MEVCQCEDVNEHLDPLGIQEQLSIVLVVQKLVYEEDKSVPLSPVLALVQPGVMSG